MRIRQLVMEREPYDLFKLKIAAIKELCAEVKFEVFTRKNMTRLIVSPAP